VWTAVASMGWYILAVIISLWYVSPYIRKKYTKWRIKKEEQDYAAKYHKNPDLLQQRLAALEASRQKMQQEYYQKCIHEQQDEKKSKETKKKALKLIDTHSSGHKLGNENNDRLDSTGKKPTSLKGDYNPLMGDNSRRYRPPKRSCCGSGGCG
ncbi:hypothetical protein WN55_10686, partial [Dufourea novaeangliae]